MEFGSAKCAIVIMKSGKRKSGKEIDLPNQESISEAWKEGKLFKNIGSGQHQTSGNEKQDIIRAINTWTVPLK